MHEACKAICIVRHRKVKKKKIAEYVCPRCEKVLSRKEVRGDAIGQWVKRCAHAYEDSGGDAQIIALLPAAVSTKHFQAYVFEKADAICYPKGRLKFGGNPAEGSSATPRRWTRASSIGDSDGSGS
jgi:hypothetical protein